MKHFLMGLLLAVLMLPVAAFAQMDTVYVPTDNPAVGGNLNNAIDSVITAGTLSNTVFKLATGGYYILTGQISTPVGSQLTIVGPPPGNTEATALPEIVLTSTGVSWGGTGVIFDIYGNFTMNNVWLLYLTTQGSQAGACINFEDDTTADVSGAGEVGIFKGDIFDDSGVPNGAGGAITLKCRDFKGTFENDFFRNDVCPTLQYYGRAISWGYQTTSWHTDSLSFVNCTFANMGYGLMQESPEWADNVWFNHCTFFNIMMFPIESNYWHNLVVTNCLFENTYMMGDQIALRGTNAQYPFGGTLALDTLSTTGISFNFKESDRHILFSNSSYYEQKWLTGFMANNAYSDTASPSYAPAPMPMINNQTLGLSENKTMWPYIQIDTSTLYDNVDPDMIAPLTNQDSIEAFLVQAWNGAPNVDWAFEPDSDLNNVWPLPGNLAYTNATLLHAAGGGLPLGDLYHWFPAQYQQWKSIEAAENDSIATEQMTGQPTAVMNEPKPTIPGKYALAQNYPNPFNPTTQIDYSVPKSGYVNITVYNVLGEKVTTLYSGVQQPGNHVVTFNADRFASGVYFYRLNAGSVSITKKMVLMK